MEHHNGEGLGGIFTLASIVLGFISANTLSELAALMAIAAGATGIILNLVKLFYYVKSKRKA